MYSYIAYLLYNCQEKNEFFLKKEAHMEKGYRVKLQKVERPTNRSYCINFPVALAEAMGMEKGEEFEWLIEDKNTLPKVVSNWLKMKDTFRKEYSYVFRSN